MKEVEPLRTVTMRELERDIYFDRKYAHRFKSRSMGSN